MSEQEKKLIQPESETVKVVLGVFKDNASVVNSLWLIFQGVSLAFLEWVYAGKADLVRNPIALTVLSPWFRHLRDGELEGD